MNPTLQQSASAMLKTGIWNDDVFVESHSIEDTYLLLYLLTCPDRHLSGITKLNPRLVTARTKWERNQVNIVLERLQQLGDVLVDGQFVWVKSHFDHNQTPSPTHFKQIRERLSEVSLDLRNHWLNDAKERGIREELIGYPYPTNTLPGNNNNNDNSNAFDNGNNNGCFSEDVSKTAQEEQSGCCDSILDWPSAAAPWESIIGPLLANLDHGLAQDLIDELAAGLVSAKPIDTPERWVAWAIKKGFPRTTSGMAFGSARKAKVSSDRRTKKMKALPPRGNEEDRIVGQQMFDNARQKRSPASPD